jgi:hypothetical protein
MRELNRVNSFISLISLESLSRYRKTKTTQDRGWFKTPVIMSPPSAGITRIRLIGHLHSFARRYLSLVCPSPREIFD